VRLVAVGNGRFFGGGMKICPEARLDDGALELVTVGDLSRGEVLANLGKLFAGTHLTLDDVDGAQVTHLVAEPHRARRGDARAPSRHVRGAARGAARFGRKVDTRYARLV
jgi:diacylglycerol kinase family enzyme